MKDLLRKLNTARRMPPKVLMGCITRFAKRRIRKYTVKFHPVKLSDRNFLNKTGYRTIDKLLNREVPLFFFNPNDEYRVVVTIKK